MDNKKILIVEDEVINALFLKKLVENQGYVCCGTATTGTDAINKSMLLQPDLILMDIFLGDEIDGIIATEKIHEKKDIPVIFLTASSDKATYERAKSVHFNSFLTKPYDNGELIKIINEICR